MNAFRLHDRHPGRALWALALLVSAACGSADATLPAEVTPDAVSYREGAATAPIHVIYFDDYVCDDCAKFSKEAMEPLRRDWIASDRARLTVVDLAWHRGSVAGSAAAYCAAEQGKYWEMHDLLFERQEVWKRVVDIPEKLAEYAVELGLDESRYRSCAARKVHQQRLEAAEEETRRFAVRGTPAFVINGKLHYGSQDWAWVEKVLEAYAAGTPEAAPPPPLKGG